MQGKLLQLVIIGNPPPGLMKELEEPILSTMGLPSVQGKVQLQTPTYAFNKDRNQYHSNAIMRRLVPLLTSSLHLGLGVTDVDLFVPDAPFIFGEADRESRTAIMSIARLRPGATPEMLRRRAQGEAVHQAGHLVGLSYCEDARCVMFLAQAPIDMDRRGLTLCNACRNELIKLSR